ncbi:MAG: MFS transporter [Trueperaceae bacterium]|nr:MFS transporter [Trueperaceae bacterium]
MAAPAPPPPEDAPRATVAASPGWPRLLGIASGSLALAAIWALYNVFMPLLLAGFLESRAARGAVMGLDNVVAVLLIPVVGAWSDRVRGRWGRRLPFLLVGVPLAALTFAGLPWAATALWSLIALDVVFLLAITLYRAPLVALMPDHVPPDARSVANGAITLMGAVGGVLALVALAPLAEAALGLPFAAVPFAVGAGLALVALAVVVASSHRHPPFVADGSVAEDAPSPRAVWRALRAQGAGAGSAAGADAGAWRGALPLLGGLFAAFFGFAAVEAQFSAFATEALAVGAGRAGTLLGTASAAFVLVAFPAGAWARRVGERAAMRLGAAVLVAALPVAGLLPDGLALSAALVVFGAGWALVVVPAYPLVADLGGCDRVGLLTGLYYLVGSSAAIVAPGVAGLAMDAFGDRALFAVAALAFAAAAVAWGRVPPRRTVGGAGDEGGPVRRAAQR